MKPHVCVDARLMSATGIGTFLKSSLLNLSQAAHCDLTLLCHEQDLEKASKLASRTIPMKSGIYTVKEQLELKKQIPCCDLFWAPHFNVPLMPIRAKKRLTTICDVYHLAHFSSLTLFQKIYAKTQI